MYSNGIVRQIDELGRIVLPVEMRNTLEWTVKTPVEMECNQEEGKIVLSKHSPSCIFCGETDDLKEYEQKSVCVNCREKLKSL